MKKVLVTGGYGIVGSAVESQIKLSRETCDLTNPRQTNKLFKLIKPDGVIHCAGKVGGIGGNSNYKGEYFHDNLMINTNVIEAARKTGVKNLVAFLSTCVFPDKVKYPLTVDQIQLGEPDESGRRRPEVKEGSEFEIKADMVIKALGFDPENLPTLFDTKELQVTKWGTIKTDFDTMETNLKGVFAAGDIVRGASLVVWAIKDGRDAAAAMKTYLENIETKKSKVA